MKSIGKKMLAWVLSILLIAGCCLVAGMPKDTVSAAETYTSGDYEYQIEGGYATITGYVGTSRSVVIPASLNGYPVSGIGGSAFDGNVSISSVIIPKSVTFLGVYAFRNCTALRTVEIQSGTVTFGNYYGSYDTFAGCTSLQSVKLAKGITEIAPYMFRDCESLREIEIPNTVSVIGTNAFLNCKNLTSIAIPSSVTAIDGSAFESCKALRTVTLSEGLSRIEQEAFQDCSSLDSIVIPKTVTFLGAYAFRNCTALRTVEIQSGMVTFDNYYGSFAGCTSLQSVKLAEGITEIAPDMFQDCMALRKISIPSSVYIIGDVRDSSGDLTDRTFNDCKGILTIYGEAGSFAQKYANANGIRFSTAEYTPYVDVADSGVYYRDAVEFVSNQGLMTGLNPTTFAPAENLSRAQFAVILYRMTGSPSTAGMNNPFGDNQPGTFYYDAVIWCNNAGIITGYYNPDGSFTGRFGPSDNISREQLATMLYRYANYVGDNTSAATSLNRFGDAAMVSSYAVDALEWAAAEGIVSGRATNPPTIAPQDNASRADVAVMLQRYLV